VDPVGAEAQLQLAIPRGEHDFEMTGKRAFPWPGTILAGATAAGMVFAGAAPLLTICVLLVWCGSLWLTRPEPAVHEARTDRATVSRDIMSEVIEPVGMALVLFDRDRIIAANARAREALGQHIIGQDARIALRHPEAVRLLEMEDGSTVTIRGLTGGRSLWQLTRQRIDPRYWLIELWDRTTEADIGRAHTDFVANASHELRTPLSAIIGYVETLAEKPSKIDPETAERFHATVLREAKRMQSLVSDLMSLSQLEAEKHDRPTDQVDIGELAARICGEFTGLIGTGRLSFERPAEPLLVTGDGKQLEQLLRNLIDNALKYGDSDKPVTVTLLGPDQGMVEVSVEDRGQGIAAEHLPHLTRRFYRTDPGRSRAAGGTGLGLAIVKHIVERHRGRLDIASTLGEGTRVSIKLPSAMVEAGVS
jgi:two-component system phosphate regulon sensor histidine kinase PhoR